MTSLRLDLHVHSWFSPDALCCPERLVTAARKIGLHGLALTDHNTSDGIEFLLDRGLMRDDGLPVDGFLVIPGVEVSTRDGHLLCLGAALPDLKGETAARVCDVIHEKGGLAIAAHPFDRLRSGIRQWKLDTIPIDGIEGFNASTMIRRFNHLANEYAVARSLPMTCGSDAHEASAVGTAYTIVRPAEFSVRGIIEEIRSSRTEFHPMYVSLRQVAIKTLGNLRRLCSRRRIHSAEQSRHLGRGDSRSVVRRSL